MQSRGKKECFASEYRTIQTISTDFSLRTGSSKQSHIKFVYEKMVVLRQLKLNTTAP